MMPPCNDVRNNLAAYLDNALDPAERAEVRMHLESCAFCTAELAGQRAVKEGLRSLGRRAETEPVPAHILTLAEAAWDRHDTAGRRRVVFRFAAAGACCALLLLVSVVWAFLIGRDAFPVQTALADYSTIREQNPSPEFSTADPDSAARWLGARLGDNTIPPIDLSLSRARLLGADVVRTTAPATGRLLYITPRGYVAIYVAPRATRFPGCREATRDGRTLQVAGQSGAQFFGWRANGIGFGLTTGANRTNADSLVRDASRHIEN